MVAAADAPASPLPTTMTSNFRLFAGFTSFMSKRCLSHFCASGPAGTWESRFISAQNFLSVAEQHGDRNGAVTQENHQRDRLGKSVQKRSVTAVLPAQRLEHGADPMAQVQAKQAHRQKVEAGDDRLVKTNNHHLIDIVPPLDIGEGR